MKKEAQKLFNESFKFAVNQEVRHKGDNKRGVSADMGLLVMARIIEETLDDEGESTFRRHYACRMIKFSGSGDIAHFKESELITIEEYNRNSIQLDKELLEMRIDSEETEKQVFASFGVKRKTRVTLLKEGNELSVYWVAGFKCDSETQLILKKELGEGLKSETIFVNSKSEFKVIE